MFPLQLKISYSFYKIQYYFLILSPVANLFRSMSWVFKLLILPLIIV